MIFIVIDAVNSMHRQCAMALVLLCAFHMEVLGS